MKLIVGLGNPGKEYENTRHNVGFQFVEYLNKACSGDTFHVDKKLKADITHLPEKRTLLAKPLTFMNLSGEAVLSIKNFYKLENADILIAYDDVDIPLGTFRLRESGSAGTHNGMRSIVHLLGDDIPRLRIGIQPTHEIHDLSSFVLGRLSKEEQDVLEKVFREAREELFPGI